MKDTVMLISFYNPKALGLKYIENALTLANYSVVTVYFKGFNSVNPKEATETEFNHLKSLISEIKPVAIGFSVMTSLYLEAVFSVNQLIKNNFDIPIIWGGVYATMFWEEAMDHANFVIRGEGEEAFVELVNEIMSGTNNYSPIQNLVYRSENSVRQNDLRELLTDLDKYGDIVIGGNKYIIDDDLIKNVDPMVGSYSYELSASRGCQFACSYCCAITLKRITAGKGKFVRIREVDSVINELVNAKKTMKNLKFIRFWDEIFCDQEDWVDEFVSRYKKEINLPFEIWGHPLRCKEETITKLRKVGLYKVVMGIQSGSPYIRRQIFNRTEKQEDIIAASKVLAKAKVPQVIYDFMLRHPFETLETLRETYELCLELAQPFELQLHGLNFLPGTDIVQKAIDMQLVTESDMQKLMYAPMKEQYNIYWQNDNKNEDMNYIYNLIYLTQFPSLRKSLKKLSIDEPTDKNRASLANLRKVGGYMARCRYLYKKGIIVLKGTKAF